jgi:hypothetical protein
MRQKFKRRNLIAWILSILGEQDLLCSTNLLYLHRKKFTTGLIELAAVMATDKVSKKRQKLFQISYKKTPKLMQWCRQTKTLI